MSKRSSTVVWKPVKVHPRAYVKAMLHAYKYPHAAVNGILVGRSAHEIVDCYPLLHTHFTLLPAWEIALMQLEALLAKSDLAIVGYYFANEHLHDTGFGAAHHALVDKIRENCFSASNAAGQPVDGDALPCVWLLDNLKMQIEEPQLAINLYRPSGKQGGGAWKCHAVSEADHADESGKATLVFVRKEGEEKGPEVTIATREVLEAFRVMAKKRKHNILLADFDDHLNDIEKDWTNQQLTEEIDKLL